MENVNERLDNIQELDNMLDVVVNKNKEQIINGKKEIVDITKHQDLTFNIDNKEVTMDIYEIITSENGITNHEFYDKNGTLLAKVDDEEFQKGKMLTEIGEGEFDRNTLLSNIYSKNNSDKSLTQLENEQTEEIADALGTDKNTIRDLNIIRLSDKDNTSSDNSREEAQSQLEMLKNMGFSVDTNELATSKQTIKEFFNIDANNLLIVKINTEWKALKIDNGKIEIEDNLKISGSTQSFSTINNNGQQEIKAPSVEFRRQDNPDYSLAVDTNGESKPKVYIIAGDSRTASEIESDNVTSPYADVKNNELMQEASENPNLTELEDEEIEEDSDIHEPDEPSLFLGPKHF